MIEMVCLFFYQVPQEMIDQCHLTYIEKGDPVSLEELIEKHGRGDMRSHTAYIDSCIQGLLKVRMLACFAASLIICFVEPFGELR